MAADNELETVSNDVFPDTDTTSFNPDEESKDPQFGGIEVLDLHGNILSAIPTGLRLLERLTSLNLVRPLI